MGLQRRSVVAVVLIVVAVFVASLLPINWHSIRWGTVPECVGAVLLLVIAVGVWRLVRASEQERERSERLL